VVALTVVLTVSVRSVKVMSSVSKCGNGNVASNPGRAA